MRIYYTPEDFVKLDFAVVTSGTFDGVHVGHQKILARLKEISTRSGGETVVITFWPHPRLILKPDKEPLKLLNTFEEKAELLREQGIDHLLRIPFTKEFSQISSSDFISQILVNTIGTRKLVIGYDHRFGKNREGSFEELKINGPAYGFEIEEILRQDIDHVAVSSSTIRKALEGGDVETAAHLLGRPYSISGEVVNGDKLGRTLGFPTANIDVDAHHKLIPREGIYVVTVLHEGEQFGGMLYIGTRPTVGGSRTSIEVNIFGFKKDIYGQSLKVNFIRFIRDDAKFVDLESLKVQLLEDEKVSREVLKEKNLL